MQLPLKISVPLLRIILYGLGAFFYANIDPASYYNKQLKRWMPSKTEVFAQPNGNLIYIEEYLPV